MANGAICPPECQLELDHLKQGIQENKNGIKTLGVAMSNRPRTRALFLIFGPILTLTLFFIGWSFNSLKDGQVEAMATLETHQERIADNLDDVKERVIELKVQLEERTGGRGDSG